MITITRGDTQPLTWTRLGPDGHTIMDAPDAMYLTVKRSWDDSDFIIQKKLTDMSQDENGAWHTMIAASETAALNYGSYVFDLEVTVLGCVTTICKDELKITREATWSANKS